MNSCHVDESDSQWNALYFKPCTKLNLANGCDNDVWLLAYTKLSSIPISWNTCLINL